MERNTDESFDKKVTGTIKSSESLSINESDEKTNPSFKKKNKSKKMVNLKNIDFHKSDNFIQEDGNNKAKFSAIKEALVELEGSSHVKTPILNKNQMFNFVEDAIDVERAKLIYSQDFKSENALTRTKSNTLKLSPNTGLIKLPRRKSSDDVDFDNIPSKRTDKYLILEETDEERRKKNRIKKPNGYSKVFEEDIERRRFSEIKIVSERGIDRISSYYRYNEETNTALEEPTLNRKENSFNISADENMIPISSQYSNNSLYQNIQRMSSLQNFKNIEEDNSMIVILVGLPGRGKSYMSKKLCNYLRWRGLNSEIFNVGNYRRIKVGAEMTHNFFDPNNEASVSAREECAILCLNDLIDWIKNYRGIAFFDGTNSNFKRRQTLMDLIEKSELRVPVLHLESICNIEKIITNNIINNKLKTPDYKNLAQQDAIDDFKNRISQYEKNYNSLDKSEFDGNIKFIQIINAGDAMKINRVYGYTQSLCVSFLINLCLDPAPIYLSTNNNYKGADVYLGANGELTERGDQFSCMLNAFFNEEQLLWKRNGYKSCKIFYSPSKACQATAETIEIENIKSRLIRCQQLNKIFYGDFETKTIQEAFNEFGLTFFEDLYTNSQINTYGETYLDVVTRINPFLLQLLKSREPIIIIAHESI